MHYNIEILRQEFSCRSLCYGIFLCKQPSLVSVERLYNGTHRLCLCCQNDLAIAIQGRLQICIQTLEASQSVGSILACCADHAFCTVDLHSTGKTTLTNGDDAAGGQVQIVDGDFAGQSQRVFAVCLDADITAQQVAAVNIDRTAVGCYATIACIVGTNSFICV